MTDMNSPSWNRFQVAQRRLNIIKKYAHEIVGVKREQVHMVVENFSKPGTYDITVHENGKVYTHTWAPPTEDLEVPASFPTFDEDKTIDEVAEVLPPQEFSPVVLQQPVVQQGVVEVSAPASPVPFDEPVVVEPLEVTKEEAKEEVLESEAVEEVPPAPEPAAAPRRRGRPAKKHV